MLQFDYCMSDSVAVKQDDNRYNASRGAHLNLKRAEKARVLVNKIPGIQRVNMPLLMVVDICQGSNIYVLCSYLSIYFLPLFSFLFPLTELFSEKLCNTSPVSLPNSYNTDSIPPKH